MYPTRLRLTSPSIRYLAMSLDVFVVWACGVGAYLFYDVTSIQGEMPHHYKWILLGATVLMLASSSSLYRSWRVNELGVMLRSVAWAWGSTILVLLALLFITKESAGYSRVWFVSWSVSTLLLLLAQRTVVYAGLRRLRRLGYNYKTVLVVGDGTASRHVLQALDECAWSGLRVVAKLQPEALPTFIAAQQASGSRLDEVWVCLPLADEAGISTALAALRHSPANIRLVPDLFALRLINHGVSEVLGIPMLDLSSSPITGGMRLSKAVEDYVLASLILLLISPLLLVIAIAVKLTSPGPALYQQRRHGWNGEEIWIYKFRSMVVHQERALQVTQATRGDARITPLGAFLRRTSLDELPQFVNVLQGRMSIVGPRPHALAHNRHYQELVPGYALRHKVKPGITGWAQVNGFRGETDTLEKMEKRVQYDLYYIENLSIWLDLKIVMATVCKGFVGRNVY